MERENSEMNNMNIFKNANIRPNKKSITKPEKSTAPPSIVEIDGLCQMLNIGKNTAYGLLTSGEIDSFKVGSVWKIPVNSINEYIERKCRESRLVKMYNVVNMNRDLYFDRHNDIALKY